MLLRALTASLLALGAAAVPAAADSIVYAKDSNLHLISPDGSRGYALTSDGAGWRSPSQADDGTIGALRGKQLARLDRSGKLLGAPIDAIGTTGGLASEFGGPYDPRISPDGTKFAYWFYVSTTTKNYDDPTRPYVDVGAYGTWTWADHFTSPVDESEYYREFQTPEWLTNDRLLGDEGFWMNMWTWKLGTGHGYTNTAAQFWFGLQDPADEWGVEAYHWYEDPALSRDGTRLAMTDGGGPIDNDRLTLASVRGPVWQGEPPYDNDYVRGETPFERPERRCVLSAPKIVNPNWSPDGRRLVYGAADGVHLVEVPSLDDCGAITDRLLVPGGSEPAFGPADVVPPAAAPPPPRQEPPQRSETTVSSAAIRPRSFRAGRSARLTFALSAPATVTATVTRGRRTVGSFRVPGAAGPNRLRWSGKVAGRRLRPGAYRLSLSAGGPATAATTFRVLPRR